MNKRPTIYAWLAILFLVAAAVYAADEIVSRTINYQNSTLTFDANTTIKDADGNWTINWSQFQFLSTNTGGGGSATVSWPSTVTNLFQSVGVVRNVTAYGAKGNGTDDDTASLVAAFAAATNGDTVFFPPGTYMLTTNSVYVEGKTIAIRGVPGQSIIKNRSTTATSDRGITIQAQIATAGGSYSLLTESIYEGKNSTNIVKVADSSIFTAGEYAWLYDASRTTNWNATDAINREIVKVERVYDSTTIDIDRVPVGTYKVGFSGRLAKMLNGATRVQVYGITMDGFGFDLQGLNGSVFEQCEVRNSVSQFQFSAFYCSNLRLIDCAAVSAPGKVPPGTSYGFSINTCVNTVIDRFRAVGVAECNVSYRSFGTTIANSIFDKTQDLNLHGVGERKSIVKDCFFKNSYMLINAGSEIGCYDTVISGNVFEGSFGSVGKISCGTVTAVSPTFNTFNLYYKSNGGIRHGMPVIFSGTVPNEITTYKTYYLVGACPTNVCVSTTKPRPPLAVTFDSTTNNFTISTGSGFAHKDVCVLDGATLPTGLSANRPYYFAQKSSGVYYLSPAPDLANPTWGVSTNTVTLTANYFFPSDAIVFQGSGTPPTGINKGQRYYLKAIGGAPANVFNLSDTDGGATVTMSGSPSGSFYTCHWFGTDGSGVFAEIGTPITSMTGTLGSVSMYPVGSDLLITGNKVSDVQAEGIQISRFVNVQCIGNSIGPEGPYKWSTPLGFNFAACDNVDVKGNVVAFKGSAGTSAYGGKLDNCRNVRFTGNTFDTPGTVNLFQGVSSTTLSQISFMDNIYANHAARTVVYQTNAANGLITGIRTGGVSRNNVYAGLHENGSAATSNTNLLSVIPGTTAANILSTASLGGDFYWVLNDNAVLPGDEITLSRAGAGAGNIWIQLQSNTNTPLCVLTNGTYGFVKVMFDGTSSFIKTAGVTNTIALP